MQTILHLKGYQFLISTSGKVKNSLITLRAEFLNALGTMRVDVQLYDAMYTAA